MPASDPADAADFIQSLLDDINASITATGATSGTYSAALDGSTVVVTYTQGESDGEADNLDIVLDINDDNIVEGPEDFALTISDAADPSSTGADIDVSTTENSVTTTIIDNDTATFTINDVAVSEGGGLEFTVTLSNPIANGLDIDVSFTDGNAI